MIVAAMGAVALLGLLMGGGGKKKRPPAEEAETEGPGAAEAQGAAEAGPPLAVVEEPDPELAKVAAITPPGSVVVADPVKGTLEIVAVDTVEEPDPVLAQAVAAAPPGAVVVADPNTGTVAVVEVDQPNVPPVVIELPEMIIKAAPDPVKPRVILKGPVVGEVIKTAVVLPPSVPAPVVAVKPPAAVKVAPKPPVVVAPPHPGRGSVPAPVVVKAPLVPPKVAAQMTDEQKQAEILKLMAAKKAAAAAAAPPVVPPEVAAQMTDAQKQDAILERVEEKQDEAEDTAAPVVEAPVVVAPAPLPVAVVEASSMAPDSHRLAQDLLAAEHLKNWQGHHKEDVRKWQAARNLKPDALFGPATALALAKEVGTAPIVRRWPRGTWKGSPAHLKYISDLTALGIDSSREHGQAYAPVQQITVFAEI